MSAKDCKGCSYSFMEPSDMNLTCGHKDAGVFGIRPHLARMADGHCGPDAKKYEQHPLREPNGDLKSRNS